MKPVNCATILPVERTDHELVEESRRGDSEAATELIRRHYGASLRIARAILRNQEDCEDAVQTAYCRAFQQLHSFREESRFSTWVTTIVVNQSLMQLRKLRRRTVLSLDEEMSGRPPRYLTSRGPTPEESTASIEVGTVIQRAVSRLPNTLRRPYILHAVSGFSVAEVAGKLGLSLSATKSRIFRARSTLETRLQASFSSKPRNSARCSERSCQHDESA